MAPVASPLSIPECRATGLARAGRRHLAEARRDARRGSLRATIGVASCPPPTALLGAGPTTLALAALLTRQGWPVVLVEQDDAAARRLTDHLARQGASLEVTPDASALARAGLILAPTGAARAGRLDGAAPDALLCLLAEGAEDARSSLAALPAHRRAGALRLVVPGAGLVEIDAPTAGRAGDATQLSELSATLGCLPLPLPQGGEGAAARLLARFEATAEALCFAGIPPWELDEAAESLGFAAGPCALMDRLGVDTALPRRARLSAAGVALADPGVIARMVAEGRLGRRASVGWYRYPGGGGRVTDPLIEDLVREEAWFAGRSPAALPVTRLQSHLLAALSDEAARLLAEGAVSRPAHIDLAAVLALGFPSALGGPVWLADRLGAGTMLAAVHALGQDLAGIPGLPPPAPGLIAAAQGERPLSSVRRD